MEVGSRGLRVVLDLGFENLSRWWYRGRVATAMESLGPHMAENQIYPNQKKKKEVNESVKKMNELRVRFHFCIYFILYIYI